MEQTLNWTNELKIEFFDLAYRKSGDTSICEIFNEFILSKKPKSLFTTEDGTEVLFNFLKIYIVNSSWNLFDRDVDWCLDKINNPAECKYFKFFSKENSAKFYILMNKPTLSLSDIGDKVNYGNDGEQRLLLSLQELAKQKINP